VSDDLFREVDEEVRQDNYRHLWKKYGVYFVSLFVIVMLITVGIVLWRDMQRSALESNGEELLAAIAIGEVNEKEAIEKFTLLGNESKEGYRLLAKLREGSLLSKIGEKAKSIEVFDSITRDMEQDEIYRDLAAILAVSHGITSMDQKELKDRLTPLLAIDNPWHYTAKELMAISLMISGDTARSIKSFKSLSDDTDAPEGIRARSAEMINILINK
tara:strand:+ start:332 stop:979 length:648 start_codon:yes stop_codon:yes gene_type:complete